MASSKFGRKLYPYRCLCEPLGVKGVWQSVVITNNSSTIDQNQQLLVRYIFPNLGAHDVIVPGTARLAFKIALNSEDANRTVVQNLGRAIVKKTVIKISGNEVMSVDDSDVFNCYGDLWKTALERKNDQYQGIDTSGNQNTTRIRIDAGNKDETVAANKAIADALISSCSRATCRSIKARLETGWSTNSPSTTTAAQIGPQTMPTPHTTLKTSV